MPNYTANAKAALIRNNTQVFFWNAETVAAGTLSIAFELERVNRSFYPWGYSVEVQFSGAPGAFEVDIMEADTDIAGYFVKVGSIVAVSATNVARFETTSLYPKYVAVLMVSLTNAVNTTVKLTR
jgi:hypothetical protein